MRFWRLLHVAARPRGEERNRLESAGLCSSKSVSFLGFLKKTTPLAALIRAHRAAHLFFSSVPSSAAGDSNSGFCCSQGKAAFLSVICGSTITAELLGGTGSVPGQATTYRRPATTTAGHRLDRRYYRARMRCGTHLRDLSGACGDGVDAMRSRCSVCLSH